MWECSAVQCGRVVSSCTFSVMCVCVFLYLVHPWDFSAGFSLSPESGLSQKHILSCIINLFECWLLWGKCWILLPFPAFSLLCMCSSEKAETLKEFTARYISAVFHSQAVQQCQEVSNKEQAGCGTSTCCSSPEKGTTEHKHAGICLFPSLQELLCWDWKTNDSLMVRGLEKGGVYSVQKGRSNAQGFLMCWLNSGLLSFRSS